MRVFDPEKLLDLRWSRRMKQVDIARKIGVQSSTISLWESGRHTPSAVSIIKLAEFLGVSPDFFYSEQFVENNYDPPAP